MNVRPVSFASSSTFSDMINMPQTYQRKETPMAATKIESAPKKKHSFGKTVLKLGVAAAAIAGALALGSKKGVFTSEKIKNETLKTVAGKLQTAGEKVCEFCGPYIQKGKNLISGLGKKAAETATEVKDKAEEVVSEVADKAQEVLTDAAPKA